MTSPVATLLRNLYFKHCRIHYFQSCGTQLDRSEWERWNADLLLRLDTAAATHDPNRWEIGRELIARYEVPFLLTLQERWAGWR